MCLTLAQATPETAGHKADGTRRLAELAARREAGFKVPCALAIPFGVLGAALRKDPQVEGQYRQLSTGFDQLPQAEWVSAAAKLRELIQTLRVPRELLAEIAQRFRSQDRLMVRSSSSCEDLPGLAGAGLYESVPNVTSANAATAIRAVWASLWTDRAAVSRRQTGIPHEQAHMAVLIQAMVSPDLSFVLHTVNPINRNAAEVYAEIALGLGETLVSGATRGNPYRLVCDKGPSQPRTIAFANFSGALRPQADGGLSRTTIDYSTVQFSRDAELRRALGRRLSVMGRLIETEFGAPQDIEGAVVGDEIWLVQARPQQGLNLAVGLKCCANF
jgi:phosphoglucan,water dikinase